MSTLANVGYAVPVPEEDFSFLGKSGMNANVGYLANNEATTGTNANVGYLANNGGIPVNNAASPTYYQQPLVQAEDDNDDGFYRPFFGQPRFGYNGYNNRNRGNNLVIVSSSPWLTRILYIFLAITIIGVLVYAIWYFINRDEIIKRTYKPPSTSPPPNPSLPSVMNNLQRYNLNGKSSPFLDDDDLNSINNNTSSYQYSRNSEENNPNDNEAVQARLIQIASIIGMDTVQQPSQDGIFHHSSSTSNQGIRFDQDYATMLKLLTDYIGESNDNNNEFENATTSNIVIDTMSYASTLAPPLFLAAGSPDGGNNNGNKRQIKQSLVTMALCPSDLYDADIYLNSGVARCNEKCPSGFESMWFEPRDQDGKRMTRKVLVTDKDGKPVMTVDASGKPVQKTRDEEIPPEAWCRAICPVRMSSKNSQLWDSRSAPSSSFLNSDSVPSKIVGSRYQRTDAGEGDAYCQVSIFDRELQRGQDKFECGWCTVTLGSMNDIGISNNRTMCDNDGQQYHIDFTSKCMKRRYSPAVWLPQEINEKSKQDNITNTPFCSGMNGQQGRPKHVKMIQGPKACYNGDLLPVLPAAYVKGTQFGGDLATKAQTPSGYIVREGASKFNKNQIILNQDGVNWSYFLEACYSKCPLWMVPFGPIENHQCREVCPPNTSAIEGMGQPDLCKKNSHVKNTHIYDLLAAVKSVSEQIVEKMGGTIS